MSDLRGRTLSGGFTAAGAQACKFVIDLVAAMILARLLTPNDFGLVAMITIIVNFLQVFKDAGLSTATIQKVEITHEQISNLFWINILVSGLMSLIIAALAPGIAWFYSESRLLGLTLALAGTFTLSGAAVQHQALLSRQMRFKAIAAIEIGAALAGLVTGVALALLNCGPWSLVGMQLSRMLSELVLTLWISPWRAQRPTRGTGTKSMLHFGASLTVASVFRRLALGCDSLLIGRWHGPDAVGLYTRGAELLTRPVDQMMAPLMAVSTPVLSRLQEDPERYRSIFLQAHQAVALLSFSLAGLFLALNRPLVLVVLGSRWEEVIPIFSWFTLTFVYYPLYYTGVWLLNTQGRGKDVILTGLIVSGTTVISIIAGLPFGPVGVALALSCAALAVRLPAQYYIAGRRGPVNTADLWAVILRYLPNWGVLFGATYFTRRMIPSDCPPLLELCLCAPAGIAAGVILTMAVPAQRREVLRIWTLVKPLVLRLHDAPGK